MSDRWGAPRAHSECTAICSGGFPLIRKVEELFLTAWLRCLGGGDAEKSVLGLYGNSVLRLLVSPALRRLAGFSGRGRRCSSFVHTTTPRSKAPPLPRARAPG